MYIVCVIPLRSINTYNFSRLRWQLIKDKFLQSSEKHGNMRQIHFTQARLTTSATARLNIPLTIESLYLKIYCTHNNNSKGAQKRTTNFLILFVLRTLVIRTFKREYDIIFLENRLPEFLRQLHGFECIICMFCSFQSHNSCMHKILIEKH